MNQSLGARSMKKKGHRKTYETGNRLSSLQKYNIYAYGYVVFAMAIPINCIYYVPLPSPFINMD